MARVTTEFLASFKELAQTMPHVGPIFATLTIGEELSPFKWSVLDSFIARADKLRATFERDAMPAVQTSIPRVLMCDAADTCMSECASSDVIVIGARRGPGRPPGSKNRPKILHAQWRRLGPSRNIVRRTGHNGAKDAHNKIVGNGSRIAKRGYRLDIAECARHVAIDKAIKHLSLKFVVDYFEEMLQKTETLEWSAYRPILKADSAYIFARRQAMRATE